MLKRLIINGLLEPPAPPVTSRDWYISAAGTGDGTTSGTPGPVSLLDPSLLFTGDRIYFNKGDTFYLGGFSISNLNNIQVLAFGSGANPILYGSSAAVNWVDNGDGYWYTSLATEPKWVVEDDTLLRQGESDWIPITSVPSAQVRRCLAATINAFDSIIGAKIVAKEFSFRASQVLTVTNYNSSNGNITFTGPLVGAAIGMPLKLYGQKQFATDTDDWAYDSSAQRLYIKTAGDPTGRNIRVINQDQCFTVSSSNNFVSDGVDYKHYFKHGLYVVNSADTQVINCEISACRGNGVRFYGNSTTDFIVDNAEIHNCGLRGIEYGGVQGYSITNCLIYDIGMQANIGYPFDAHKTGGTAITQLTDAALSTILSNDGLIEHNEIYNVGYQGIQLFGTGTTIQKNEIHDYCMKWADGGGIYLYYNNVFNGATSGNICQNNIVYDGNVTNNTEGITSGAITLVAGIYFDAGINDNTADNNVIYNPGEYGVFCNTHGTGHVITDNLVTGASIAQVQIRQDTNPDANFPFNNCEDCVLTGNILVSESSAARCMSLLNANGLATFNPFISVNNNHYVHPYELDINNRSQNNGGAFTDMTLAEWQTYISGDAAATERTDYKGGAPDADDVLVEINPTDAPVNFNTPVGYSDYEGNAFSNPVSIPAWYGLIYFED